MILRSQNIQNTLNSKIYVPKTIKEIYMNNVRRLTHHCYLRLQLELHGKTLEWLRIWVNLDMTSICWGKFKLAKVAISKEMAIFLMLTPFLVVWNLRKLNKIKSMVKTILKVHLYLPIQLSISMEGSQKMSYSSLKEMYKSLLRSSMKRVYTSISLCILSMGW